MKARIVERSYPNSKEYVIQEKHFLFRWWWVDAWVNSIDPNMKCAFGTLEEAKQALDAMQWNIRETVVLEIDQQYEPRG